MSKQIRVPDTVFDEMKRLAEKYDIDKRGILNASIVLLKCAIENDAKYVEFTDADGKHIKIPMPLLFKKSK